MSALQPTADTAPLLRAVERSGADAAQAVVAWPGTLPVFAGHFPGAPVVPGVYLLAAALALATQLTGAPLRLTRCTRVRFLQPVRPDEPVELRVRLLPAAAGGVAIDARVARAGVAVLQARLEAAPA